MEPEDQIVQYILIRTDLEWNSGSFVAQACHASVAAITENFEHELVKKYLRDIDQMRKIVLSCPEEVVLKECSSKLKVKNIPHKLWIEQPEDIPTCIATMMLLNFLPICGRKHKVFIPLAYIASGSFFRMRIFPEFLVKGHTNKGIIFRSFSESRQSERKPFECKNNRFGWRGTKGRTIFGIGLFACLSYLLTLKKLFGSFNLGSRFERFNEWSYNLLIDNIINKLVPPNEEPLLPDFNQLGYPENLPTLVVGLRGLLCDVTYNRKNGWGIVKRPGADKFFEELKHYYEIVVWSDDQFPAPQEIVEKWNLPIIGILDKSHFTRKDGRTYKDLSRLGRNLDRVVLVDKESESSSFQSENSIVLPIFEGSPYDNELESLIDLLKATSLQPGDVKTYLRRFRDSNTKIGDRFNEYKKIISEKSGARRKFNKFLPK
ncbi:putative mitochondrial import inner membrane translocase subunit TIM50 [Cryptosporidium felis]|nr:putative mitochondrial import inner membrane translocase subunit TIM50 [Cryptosporidium felis]